MAYDDGYYYGQCKIVCEAETTVDNGKTVSISSTTGTFTASKSLSDKIAEFLVPGRDRYTVTLLDGTVTKWTGTIEAGYGECVHVMLADGYEPVIKKDYDAKMASLDAQLTTGTTPFRFGKTTDGRYGYIINSGGADSVIPFNSKQTIKTIGYGGSWTADKNYSSAVMCGSYSGSGWSDNRYWVKIEFFKNNVSLGNKTSDWGQYYSKNATLSVNVGKINKGDVLKSTATNNGQTVEHGGDAWVILIE